MIYDKTCGNVRLTVDQHREPAPPMVSIGAQNQVLNRLVLEDLRDLRHLIDAALRAAK